MHDINYWISEYGKSHQHPTNKLIHWICVPIINWTIILFIWLIPQPGWLQEIHWLNWAGLFVLAIMTFYIRLSPKLSIGMGLFNALVLYLSSIVVENIHQAAALGIAIFIAAWIGQFIGHKIEGRKPAFIDDLVFLLIGPIWLMNNLYTKLGRQ